MKPPVVVIVNPRARSVRRDPRVTERLRQLVGAAGRVLAPDTPDALLDALRAAKHDGVTHLAWHGGDGTGHRCTTALFQAWGDAPPPSLMWLHGGTMNTVSRSMGQRGRPPDQLRAFLDDAAGRATLARTRRWPLCIDSARYGWLWGIGIVPRFIEVYESGGEPSPLKAAATLARAVASSLTGGPFADAFFRGIPCEVTLDGQRWPDRAWRIFTVGAVHDIGLQFRPFPGVLTHPGCFHAFGSASPPAAFTADLLPLRLARPARHPLAHDGVGRVLRLKANEPLRYNLDGDLYDTGPEVEVSAGPPLTFLLAPGARPPENTLGP